MKPHAVESECFASFNIFGELHGVTRRIHSARIIALIHNESLKNRLAVQRIFHTVVTRFAQSEVRTHFVALVLDRHVVKIAFALAPQVRFAKVERKRGLIGDLARRAPDFSAVVVCSDTVISLAVSQ